MKAQGWMTPLKSIANRDQCRIPIDRTIEDAINQMMTSGKGVVVFIEEEKPVGVLTERDIVSFLHAGINLQAPLSTVKHPPLTVTEDKTLLFGLNMLIDNNIRRIIIVDLPGRFMGVVTQDDLIKYLESELYQQDARIMDVISSKQPLRSVSAEDDLSRAVEMMATHKIGSVLVVENEKIAGIITEKDMLRIAKEGSLPRRKAAEVMTSPVITASVDSSVSQVLEIMKAENIRRILINYSDGAPFRIITNRDILRNIENSYLDFLNRKIRHAREVLDFLPEVIVEVVDVSGEQVIQWCNRKTKEEFGSDMANLPITSLIPRESWNALYPTIVAQGKLEKTKVEIGERIFELSASYMKMQREGIIQAILIDVTSEVKKSTRDFLTGVYNRRKFDEIIKHEMDRAKRYLHPLALVMIDIDHFKTVNDSFGHQAGDKILQELTRIIAQDIREVDYLARYGGEEFLVLAPDTDLAGIALLAEKLRCIVEAHRFAGRNKITISLGVTQMTEDDSPASLIERVDAALYRAKAKGRNRVERSERGKK